MVLVRKKPLSHIVENNKVTLVWVHGFTGLRGDEEVDKLDKESSLGIPIGAETFGAYQMTKNAEGKVFDSMRIYSRTKTSEKVHTSKLIRI